MDISQVSLQKMKKHPGVLSSCHKKEGRAGCKFRKGLSGRTGRLQWELNRIHLLISYILLRGEAKACGQESHRAPVSAYHYPVLAGRRTWSSGRLLYSC